MPAAAKIATESAIFGGLAAAEGGDAEDIAIAAAIPATLGVARAGKRVLRERAAAKQLASDKAVLEQAVAEQRVEPAKPRIRVQAELGKDVGPVQGRTQMPASADVSTQPTTPNKLPSARQEYLQQKREAMGLPPAEEVIPRGTREQWQKEAIEQGKVDQAFDIARDLLAKPRAATPQESEGMFIRSEQLAAEYDAVGEKIAGLPADSSERGMLVQRMDDLSKRYDVLNKVLDTVAGRAAGQALGVRRGLLGDNTNTLSVIGRAEAVAGKPLAPEAKSKLVGTVKALRDASERSKGITAKSRERSARRAIRSGGRLSRYAKMTEAEKDVELQGLLAQEQTPKTLHDIAMNIASRDSGATAESVVRKMQSLIPGLEPGDVTDAIVTTTQRKAANTNATIQLLQSLKRTFRKIDREGIAIRDVLYWLKSGEMPGPRERTSISEDAVVQLLKEIHAGAKRVLAGSEPAQQQKMQRKLDFLAARIANRDFGPKAKQMAYEPSDQVLRMQYQAARLDGEIRRQIEQQKPWTWRGVAAEPLRTIMALKSSFDLSGLGNQGGWALLSHPVRTLRRVPEALAAFASEEKAWKINEKIRQRDNAHLYFRDGLELVEATGHAAFTRGEEQYRSSLAEYIPGIKGSNRSFATLLNLIRADSYDAMTRSFAGDGGPTRIEGKAIADFINMLTGRGNVEGYEQTISAMNGLFWAPRRAISRFQTIATLGGQLEFGRSSRPGQRKYSPVHLRGTSATRKMFAAEMGRYAAGLTTIYTLAALAGATIELDPRSSDFGKARFGNVRIDPLSGLSQTLVLLSREISGQVKKDSGEVVDIRGADRPYKGDTMGTVGLRFLSYKANPGLAVGWSILSGETEFDGPTTPWTVLEGSLMPMSFEDIRKAIEDQGLSRGAALTMIGLIGMGVQVYGDELTRAEYEEMYGND